MAIDEPTRPRGPARHRGGLVVVDEAQNRADAGAFLRSQGLLQAGRIDDATAILRGLATPPTTTVRCHAAMVLGAILVGAGDAEGALAVVDAIPAPGTAGASGDPGFIALVRSQACRRLGRHTEAVAAGEAALAASPTADRSLVLASAWLSSGHPREAAAVLLDGLERAPDDVSLLGQYAGALVLAGEEDEARAAIARLDARAAAGDAEWHRQRAWVAACRGDRVAGQAALDRALALDGPGTRAFFLDDDLMARAGLGT